VIAAALDSTDTANTGKICQELGVAKSATELVTDDLGYITL
jgi:5-enolpyruvylshikimate-3-phosphate synthase